MNESAYHLHQIDPVAFSVGGFAIYWYSMMYLVAFAAFWLLGRVRANRADAPLAPKQVGDFLFWGVIGVIVGGRLGYVLFYGFDQLLANPLFLFHIRDGGMSFHGGLAGVLVAIWLYGRHLGCGFLRLGDFIAPLVPIGLAAGRVGNFIGGELWGRLTDAPWAVIFPAAVPAGALSANRCDSSIWKVRWMRLRAILRSCTRRRWKGCCCLWSCGSTRPGRGQPVRSVAYFSPAMRCCALWPNFSASPMPSWALWPWTG